MTADRASGLLAFLFTLVILVFAASGPLSEFVRWFIETTTPDFETLSRRELDLRVAVRVSGVRFADLFEARQCLSELTPACELE